MENSPPGIQTIPSGGSSVGRRESITVGANVFARMFAFGKREVLGIPGVGVPFKRVRRTAPHTRTAVTNVKTIALGQPNAAGRGFSAGVGGGT